MGAGLGQGGFAKGAIYSGSQSNGQIYFVPPSGAPTLFATVPTGDVRQIFFDPGSSFGGNMLVTTSVGDVYEITPGGSVTLLASVGEDTEGMDIAPAGWGALAGQLLVSSETTGTIRAISPGGAITTVATGVPQAETVSAGPTTFSAAGPPTQGFYVANCTYDIQLADYTQFAGYEGDVIVTSEFGSSSPVWSLTGHSGGTVSVNPTPIGYLPAQSEDGIFVSGERVNDLIPEAGQHRGAGPRSCGSRPAAAPAALRGAWRRICQCAGRSDEAMTGRSPCALAMNARISAGSFTPRRAPRRTTHRPPSRRWRGSPWRRCPASGRRPAATAPAPSSRAAATSRTRAALPPGRVAPAGGFASSSSASAPAGVARQVGGGADADRAPDRQAEARAQRGAAIAPAVELQHIQPHRVQHRGDRVVGRLDEQADARRAAGMPRRQRRGLRRRHAARRGREEHEPDPVGAGRDRGVERRRIVDAADLDPDAHRDLGGDGRGGGGGIGAPR